MPTNFKSGVVNIVQDIEADFGMLDAMSEGYTQHGARMVAGGFAALAKELCEKYEAPAVSVKCVDFSAASWKVQGASKKSSYNEETATIVLKAKPSFITFLNRIARHLGKRDPVAWSRDLFAQAFPDEARNLSVVGNSMVSTNDTGNSARAVVENDDCDDDQDN